MTRKTKTERLIPKFVPTDFLDDFMTALGDQWHSDFCVVPKVFGVYLNNSYKSNFLVHSQKLY